MTIAWMSIAGTATAAERPAPADGPASLYFLSIGVQDYDFLPENAARPVFAPRNSAKRVADLLRRAGASYGILLTRNLDGGTGGYVTRNDVEEALRDLKQRIRQDDPVAPRIVVYFMGHGLGDTVGRYLYMLPENFSLLDNRQASQTTTLRLIKSTLWNFDLVSALVNFRMHPSMVHFDDFLPSQIMPDFTNAVDLAATMARSQELRRVDAERRAAGAYPPEGNPPVPYLLLFDNCYGGVDQDLVPISDQFSAAVDEVVADIETDGLVLYAAKPGKEVGDYHDPAVMQDSSELDRLGPLAFRLAVVEKDRLPGNGMSLPEFGRAIHEVEAVSSAPSDLHGGSPPVAVPRPYSVSNLVEDVARVEFLPRRPQTLPPEYELRFGTGNGPATCCGLP